MRNQLQRYQFQIPFPFTSLAISTLLPCKSPHESRFKSRKDLVDRNGDRAGYPGFYLGLHKWVRQWISISIFANRTWSPTFASFQAQTAASARGLVLPCICNLVSACIFNVVLSQISSPVSGPPSGTLPVLPASGVDDSYKSVHLVH